MLKRTWLRLSEVILLRHRFEITTDLSLKRIHRYIELFVQENEDTYYGWLEDDGFTVKEKPIKAWIFGGSRNSGAPIAIAKIRENGGKSIVSVEIRARRPEQILFCGLYGLLVFCLFFNASGWVLLLLFTLVAYLSVFLPAKKLKKRLIAALSGE